MTDMSFPQAFVINLDHRTDRWATIEQTCKAAGICPERIPAVQASPGWRGCAISHVQCIRLAKEKALPWVLILEDDATFSRESIERFRALLIYLWQHREEWERFNGGPTFAPDPKFKLLSQIPPLVYANGLTTHFELIHSGAYETILQYDVERDPQIDVFYMALEAQFRTRFNSVATYPHISRQCDRYSDNMSAEMDYEGYFNYSERKLHEFFAALPRSFSNRSRDPEWPHQ